MLTDLHNRNCTIHHQVGNMVLATRTVADYRTSLLDEELLDHQHSDSTARQMQFSTGRHCVRLCQDMLQAQRQSVPRSGRVPQWPPPWRGSISHTPQLAAAAMSRSHDGVGIDLELGGRVQDNERLIARLFRPDEPVLWHHQKLADPFTLGFSAKEAGYKAIYPLGGAYIGFQEVAVHLKEDGTFTFSYFGNHTTNRLLEQGQGFWQRMDDHILSVFVIG